MSLWKHECMRVISDRFTNQSDKDWFEKTMKRVAAEELGEELQAMIEDTPYLVDFLRFVRADCYEFQEWTTDMMPRFRNFTVIITRLLCFFSVSFRDAPEATGDEPEDADFETPKVYELVQYEIIRDCGFERERQGTIN